MITKSRITAQQRLELKKKAKESQSKRNKAKKASLARAMQLAGKQQYKSKRSSA